MNEYLSYFKSEVLQDDILRLLAAGHERGRRAGRCASEAGRLGESGSRRDAGITTAATTGTFADELPINTIVSSCSPTGRGPKALLRDSVLHTSDVPKMSDSYL